MPLRSFQRRHAWPGRRGDAPYHTLEWKEHEAVEGSTCTEEEVAETAVITAQPQARWWKRFPCTVVNIITKRFKGDAHKIRAEIQLSACHCECIKLQMKSQKEWDEEREGVQRGWEEEKEGWEDERKGWVGEREAWAKQEGEYQAMIASLRKDVKGKDDIIADKVHIIRLQDEKLGACPEGLTTKGRGAWSRDVDNNPLQSSAS